MKKIDSIETTIAGNKIECTPFDLSNVMDCESENFTAQIAPEPREIEMQLYRVIGNKAFFRDDKGNTLNLESTDIKELTDNVRSGYKHGEKVKLLIE